LNTLFHMTGDVPQSCLLIIMFKKFLRALCSEISHGYTKLRNFDTLKV
jgi:hypothetical protein